MLKECFCGKSEREKETKPWRKLKRERKKNRPWREREREIADRKT